MVRLEGERVILRPLRQDELDAVLEARDRLGVGAPGDARARARLRRRLGRSGHLVRGHLDLGVEVDGRLIGEIQARGDPAQTLPPGVYELGIVVFDRADRGQGHGAEAVELLTRWLFERAGAARVQAGTAVDNAAMRRVLERLGFTCEGVMRAFAPEGPGRARADYALYAVTTATDRPVTEPPPPWPATPPAHGPVVLRAFTDEDAHLAVELGEDPYLAIIGSLPAHPTARQALDWTRRQPGQLAERQRFSFVIADAGSGTAVGAIGLGVEQRSEGRATAGYAVSPLHRGRGIATSALKALTAFAWTIPELHRVELYIEPWNTGSVRVAEAAGYRREGLLRSHQELGGTRRDMLLYAVTRP
jgi:RimJ/RimL family protein N-acetyltransferase